MTELIRGRGQGTYPGLCDSTIQPNYHTVPPLHFATVRIRTHDFSMSVFIIGINSHLSYSEMSHRIRKTELCNTPPFTKCEKKEACMDLCLLRGVR